MCGFAGELLFPDGRADLDLAVSMASRLVHRGPDEAGSFLSADGRCAIGFRRLAIIDPPGSQQPMSTSDAAVTVAFNGEIYNFRELRESLQAGGAEFRTAGDTEVLLHLYQRHGLDMLEHLDGMFAIALYDAPAGRLVLARDRLGQKPLWYALLSDRIVFASEAKALLGHHMVNSTTSHTSIASFLTMGYIPAPASIWCGVSKLLPAHLLTVDKKAGPPTCYWRPKLGDPPACEAEAAELVFSRLKDAVEARMVSDVPLGALLSGGIDSSIVTALMCRSAGAAGGVRTFTAGFADNEFDERPPARRLAQRLGTDHTELLIQPSPAEQFDELVRIYDEPFADSSAMATWLICKAARRHVTVALGGDGGDEVFAGYDRHRAVYYAHNLSTPAYLALRLGGMALSMVAPKDERNRLRRFVRFADALPYPSSQQYFIYRRLFGPADIQRLLEPGFLSGIDAFAPQQWFSDLYEHGDFPDELARLQHHDLMTYLPDDLLVKADIASMAASLELRAPMLDHRLVELGLSLPPKMKVSRLHGKRILRLAFAGLVPDDVFDAPKRGFALPLGGWLRNELRPMLVDALLGGPLLEQGICRPEALAGLVNDHLTGKDDHRHRLWALLVLSRWLQMQ